MPDEFRRAVQAAPELAGREVIAGMRPEHFEDAALVPAERHGGATFKANIDVLESLGSEYYAHFEVDSERVSVKELDELAEDAGSADLPGARSDRLQMVVRLASASKAKREQPLDLWFDAQQLQLFDPASGRSLLESGRQAAGMEISVAA